jgi:hypothetical protein
MRILFAVGIFSGGLSLLGQSHPSGGVAAGRPSAPHPVSGAAKATPGVRVPPAIASGGFAASEHGANHFPAQVTGQTFSRPVTTFSPPMSTFSRPDTTFSRPDSTFSRSLITTTPQMLIRPDGHGGFRAFLRAPGGAHPEQLPGRAPSAPFFSGYRFQPARGPYGNFQYGAQGYPIGWGAGPNSVIVMNNDAQAYWDDGSADGASYGPMWGAAPMEVNGAEQSPPPWMTDANGFAGQQGMPAIVMMPPPRREELVVVDFPPGARVLR